MKMLENYSQQKRKNKMELFLIAVVALILIVAFVSVQLVAILFLLTENKRIGEELEKNQPPF